MEILLFLNGIIFFYSKNLLPWVFLFAVCFLKPRPLFIWAFLCGIGWAACHHFFVRPQGMPQVSVMRHAVLSGTVESLPTQTGDKTQFQFLAMNLNHQPVRAHILISCYQNCPTIIQQGQHWTLTAKISKPRDYANPGGFGFVRWLAVKHIYWIGTMQFGQLSEVPQDKPKLILNIRNKLANQLEKLGFQENSLGIVQALALGLTDHLDKSLWDLFRRTGTTHLMVISGAHIGLMAGFGFAMTKWLWCRAEYFCLHIPAQKAAAIVGMLFAIIYALLAGFAVPAQRSCVACCMMLSRYFLSHRFSTWQAWRYAIFVVLLIEPHAIYLSGFYLSFFAVAILVVMNQWVRWKGFRNMIAMQLSCLVGLMPLTLYWFSYGAVNGLMANILAIPWVGFVLVPLSLLTTMLGQWPIATWLSWGLHQAVTGLLYYLKAIDTLAWMNLSVSYPNIIVPLAMLMAICVCLFLPLKQFSMATSLLLLLGIYPKHESIKYGEAKLDVLDVGQGLAIVIRTAKHQMLYDTGMKFYKSSDMGKMVVVPYLQTLGITTLDKVVISHPDLDHRGGLPSIAETFPIHELIVDDPQKYQHALPCHRYPDWTWEGVNFHFFQIKTDLHSKNNTSCVLQVKTQQGSILLTGDIEKKAEFYLVTNYGQELKSDLMVVPHHGSKTSSTPLFLALVNPNQAVFSYGFDNRYHFPHATVMTRYQAQHIALFNTVDCGMVSILLRQTGIQKPVCYRSHT